MGLFVDANTGSFTAPRDTNTHWNDSGYSRKDSQEFGVGTGFENGLYGFVFHCSCWSVLERVFHPKPVPMDNLYELCLSMPKPLQTSCINWGHDYGGLHYWEKRPYLPWDVIEEPTIYDMDDLQDPEPGDSEASREWAAKYGLPPSRQDDSDDDEWTEPTLRISTLISDPYHSDEIQRILQDPPKAPPERAFRYLLPHADGDLFPQLPQELRIAISKYLPTADFLNGRLALRGLWDIFDSQQFWATRFLGHKAERSWVFESYDLVGSTHDWRFLYKQTSDAFVSQSSSLRNRSRVWQLARRLRSILSLKPLTRLPPVENQAGDGEFEWSTAQADVCQPSPEEPHKAFVRGCRVLHRQRVQLKSPASNQKIGLSFVKVGEKSYLSGLRLSSRTGEDVQIGYQAFNERIVDLGCEELTGIKLAISPRGIQALQFVTNGNGDRARWYGQPEDVPQTNRLVLESPLTDLDIGLDVGSSWRELALSH